MYYLWAVLLVLGNATAWSTNALSLPGNWLIVALTAIFALLIPEADGRGISWTVVGLVAGLAAFGEVVEFAAGAAGAGRRGGSRRGMALAVLGTLIGSIVGAFAGIPIPLLGPVIGALAGGALGAFAGAWAGEIWIGRGWRDGLAVGQGALIGRLLGTAGKLAIGAVMVVVVAVDAFF